MYKIRDNELSEFVCEKTNIEIKDYFAWKTKDGKIILPFGEWVEIYEDEKELKLSVNSQGQINEFAIIDKASITEREISEIRTELQDGGYLKIKKNSKIKKEKTLPPLEFESTDGFRILVGRNNVQNDVLTLKTAKNYDMWLHVQKQAGSHTVICSDNKEITETAIREAAVIAAYHSKSVNSSSVAVDYTIIKNVKKPVGAKPGKVIYNTYSTVYVTPQKELVEKLKKE